AGCEAALALARLGFETILFTVSVESIALMPCNPNIGGSSKGHLVRELFFSGGLHINEQAVMTNARHREAVNEAVKSLSFVMESIENGLPEDFYTVDLMDAYASLGKIIGQEVGDDIIDAVFSRFCMGK
ncbi:MAG: FAD-dependent oxidoreductase, partial [Lachnospiraceae bacterium]|nr:FAD-dependent oxidoreductase [Lachnospiraceae bacterium]